MSSEPRADGLRTGLSRSSPARTLQVSELTRYLKYVIEGDEYLAQLAVHGEISDLSRSPGGHP